jgi:hypothetical protein
VDDSVRRRCFAGPCRPGGPVRVLAGTLGRAGDPFDSAAAAQARLRGPDVVEFRYDSARARAYFQTYPGVLDAGTSYDVALASASGFDGRWQDGSLGGFEVRRGSVDAFEASRGYFCADRIGPAVAR